MKKLLAFALPLLLAAASVRADVIYQELFNYTNGLITVTSTNVVGGILVTNWVRHSGSANDAFVKNQRLENASSSSGAGLPSRSDDVHRNFTSNTNTQTILYASFIINATNLPAVAAGYFAHFYVSSTTFYARIYSQLGVLPNTYRLSVSGSAGTPIVFPADLALNQDYQVVVEWDPVNNYDATLWINPVSSSDPNVISSDAVATPGIAVAYAFRQASGMGNWFCTISNLVTATSFDEAATNVWASNSIPNSIVYDLKPTTIYVAVPSQLSVVVAGQGLADLVYYWQKDGGDISNPNGNSYIFGLPSPVLTDSGTYSVTVSNSITGQTVASTAVAVSVINGPPVILAQPTNQSVYLGKNITISAGVVGTPPLYYSWLYNNGAPVTANIDSSTTNTANLVINGVTSANTNLGGFKCVITNAYGSITSSVATVKILVPQVVNINTLHSFVDSTFYLPTNTTIYYTVTNAVVYSLEVTNSAGSVNGGPFTPPTNGEFFIQDNSGGIAVFVAGGYAVQPRQGDIVNITGPLSQFNSMLQFNLSVSDPSTILTVVSHNNPLPAPVTLPYSFTNGIGFGGVSNVIHQYVGRLVTLTNSYFAAHTNGAVFGSGNYTLTNLNGDTFTFFLNQANTNIIGQPVPQFARSITGAMSYFLSTTATNRSAGFELDPYGYSDIVGGPNSPVGMIVVTGGGVPVINWLAQPAVPYSVLWSTNVSGPYVPLVTDLTFTTTAGTYTDMVNTNLPASFYKISSP